MKNIKFSRLFAAMMFVAVLSFAGCKQQPEETPKAIEGTWVSGTEKYVISGTDYDNYSRYDSNYIRHNDEWFLYYSTNNVVIVEEDETSGYVYGQFDDAAHLGYEAKLGQWYAFYYFDLTDTSVKISQASNPKGADGKWACDSFEEAKLEFTLENGYMSKTGPYTYSTLYKQQ